MAPPTPRCSIGQRGSRLGPTRFFCFSLINVVAKPSSFSPRGESSRPRQRPARVAPRLRSSFLTVQGIRKYATNNPNSNVQRSPKNRESSFFFFPGFESERKRTLIQSFKKERSNSSRNFQLTLFYPLCYYFIWMQVKGNG